MRLLRFVMSGLLMVGLASCAAQNTHTTSLTPVTTAKLDSLTTRGADWLASQQKEDGSFGLFQADLGITCLAITGIHRVDPVAHKSVIDKGVQLALSRQNTSGKDQGAFADKDGKYLNYKTCVAIMMLHEIDADKYRSEIEAGQRYIKGLQFLEEQEKRDFGAIGYGSKLRGDLSNTQFAMEALIKTGVSPSDPVFKRAKTYLLRLQNYKESGDVKVWDGGFPYAFRDDGKSKAIIDDPEFGPRFKSYGGMTYAGLKSMIYARLEPADPRVGAAKEWISRNYTLEENPGLAPLAEPVKGQQGLYYYYHTFAKTLALMEQEDVPLPKEAMNWRSDLIEACATRQKPEGYWVNEGHQRWWESDSHLSTSYVLLALTEL